MEGFKILSRTVSFHIPNYICLLEILLFLILVSSIYFIGRSITQNYNVLTIVLTSLLSFICMTSIVFILKQYANREFTYKISPISKTAKLDKSKYTVYKVEGDIWTVKYNK